MQRIVVAVLSVLCCLGSIAPLAAEEQPVATQLAKVKVLDLKTAQSLALTGNPTLGAAQSRIEQAQARVRQAAAAWWPSLDLSGSGSRQHLSDTSFQSSQAFAECLEVNAGGPAIDYNELRFFLSAKVQHEAVALAGVESFQCKNHSGVSLVERWR